MADVIKEFLVGLGFKVDDVQYRKMMDSIGKVTAHTLKFGEAAVATGFAVEAGMEKVARQFSDLYYQSQLTNAPIRSLMQLRYAAGQTGLTADQASSALDSLAAAMRTNPGTEGFLQSLGVQTRTANGQLRDTQKVIDDLVTNLKSEFGPNGYFAAAQVAGQFGISEPTFRLMWLNNERRIAQEKELARLQKEMGFNADDAGKKFLAFDRNVSRLFAMFETAGYKVAEDFLPQFNAAIIGIGDAIEWVGNENVRVGSEFGPIAQKLIEGAEAVAVAFGGWKLVLTPLTRMLLRIVGLGGKANAVAKAVATTGAAQTTATTAAVEAAAPAEVAAGIGGGTIGLGLAAGAAGTYWALDKTNTALAPQGYMLDPELGLLRMEYIHQPAHPEPATLPGGSYLRKAWRWLDPNAVKAAAPPSIPTRTGNVSLLNLVKRLENSGEGAVSPAGAIGSYQIMPKTGEHYGFSRGQLFDPSINRFVASELLTDLGKRYHGDTDLELIDYNAGPKAVERYLASGRVLGSLPLETQAYLTRAHRYERDQGPITVSQTNNISVTGGGDPNVAAVNVRKAVAATSTDLGQAMRNLRGNEG